MLRYKTKIVDYYGLETKIPKDRALTNYIYNNFDFDITDIGFKTGNLNLVHECVNDFIKANNNVFKKIKKWDFANSLKARLYIIDFMLTILCRRYIMKCDGKFPHIQHLLSTKHLLEEPQEDKNIKIVFGAFVCRRNMISSTFVRTRHLRCKNGAII